MITNIERVNTACCWLVSLSLPSDNCSRIQVRVNYRADFRDPICWETTLLSMLSHDLFVTGDIDTIGFVIRNVALHPLNIGP
jgi:hypothetical protein